MFTVTDPIVWDCRIVDVQDPCSCPSCRIAHNREHDHFTATCTIGWYPIKNVTAPFYYHGPLRSDMPSRRYRVGERFRWKVSRDVEELSFF